MNPETVRIHAAEGTWVVRAGGAVLVETTEALELFEGDYPSVIYFPRDDVGMAFFEPSETTSASAALGQARYFHISASNGLIRDACWSYETPAPAAQRIAGRLAFSRHLVTVEQV